MTQVLLDARLSEIKEVELDARVIDFNGWIAELESDVGGLRFRFEIAVADGLQHAHDLLFPTATVKVRIAP